MNGFEQIKSFYSWVFNNPDKVKPTHISLYLFLLNQNNRSMWVEWFKCPFDLAMQGSCIGSKTTYYRCLKELQSFGLLEYKEGLNNYKAPLIRLICLYKSEPLTEQVTVPLSEQVTVQATEQLSVQLNGHIYKLITDNLKLINENKDSFFNFIKNLKEKENNIDPINWGVLLSFFNKQFNKKCTVVSDKVKSKFKARLKEGYTKKNIFNAIINISRDEYHIETKYKYATLEFISRSDKLDAYGQDEPIKYLGTTNQKIMKYDHN